MPVRYVRIGCRCRRFAILVGCLAASREIYRIGLGCPLDKIAETWNKAEANPIKPKVVETAPCQEIVYQGADLDKPGQGLDGIPVPMSTPGWDNAPYTTLSQYITKDPDTGVIKARTVVKAGAAFELFVWKDGGWKSRGRIEVTDGAHSFDGLCGDGLYWLVEDGSKKLERIFTIEQGKQVFW